MYVKFDNIKIKEKNDIVIFSEKEYGIGQLEYLELLLSDIDYIYYHYGDDPMTKIVIAACDYNDWLKEILNGTNL